jgi:putative ABC transport system permease protein
LGGLATLRESAVANPVFDVIGIVETSRNRGVQDPPMPEVFIPYTTTGAFDRGLLVKTTGSPAALAERIRREIWAVDRRVATTMVAPLTDSLSQFSYAQPRFGLVVLGVFASVGLVLVVLGVFSMIAYTVARQTHEIGIRMALGAGRAEVLRMVLWLGVRLTGGGILVGLAASLAATRVLASQLFGIEPHDPVTLVAVVLVVAAAALSASYLPARRATRVDPMEALRCE